MAMIGLVGERGINYMNKGNIKIFLIQFFIYILVSFLTSLLWSIIFNIPLKSFLRSVIFIMAIPLTLRNNGGQTNWGKLIGYSALISFVCTTLVFIINQFIFK